LKIDFSHEPLAQLPSSVVVVYGFEGAAAASGTAQRLSAETRTLLDELQTSGELTGKSYECTLVHRPAGDCGAEPPPHQMIEERDGGDALDDLR